MAGSPGCPVLSGTISLLPDAFSAGAISNPTRSLLLGDPAGGATVYGCVIDVAGVDELVNGMTATARFLFWNPQSPPLPGPIALWVGKIVGHAHGLQRVDDTA